MTNKFYINETLNSLISLQRFIVKQIFETSSECHKENTAETGEQYWDILAIEIYWLKKKPNYKVYFLNFLFTV